LFVLRPTHSFADVGYLAGCLVGGGSAINGMLFWYPTPTDFSTANGWPSSWTSMQPYTNMVTARIPGTNRPSTDNQWYLDQTFTVVGGFLKNAGYSNITINSNPSFKDHAYGQSEYAVAGGLRSGPVATYLQSAKARSNFKFITNSTVQAVTRNGAQATGVRTNTGYYTLNTNGRVILSAGTFGSARILLQSGIGPTDQLNIAKANTKQGAYLPPSTQWINLPVGYNVSDNPSINLVFSQPTIDS
jgi:cellobiose dehydrogenase (acceptor)